MHNLLLSEDQDLVVDSVRKFVTEVVAPKALEHDEHRVLAAAEFAGIAELGVFGIAVGEAAGGAAMGYLPFVAALELVGAHSSSLARLMVGQLQCAQALEAAGHSALDGIVGGSEVAVFLGPECGLRLAGSALTGTCELVAGGMAAAQFVVAASDGHEPVLALVAATAAQRTPLHSLGLASSGPARVQFAGCQAQVVARGAVAAQAIDKARLAGWLGTAATCCGGGAESVQLGRRHAGQRIAFGKPLLAQEAVLRKLGEAQRAVDGARHLTWHAARLADLGQDAAAVALQARIAAVDAMVLAADESIQIHGGFGYTVEYHVERHYRDGKTLEVLDGGSERLRDQLAVRQFA
jgi:alkylation response protein AidB-like acyl-CoA dehydrogenase